MANTSYIDIKNAFETVSLQHTQVKKFDFGDNWESTVGGDGADSYPKIYFETPILGSIDRQKKTFSFGLVCFIYPSEVYVTKDHFQAVTDAAAILEEIITKVSQDYKSTLSITFPYSTTTFVLDTTSMLDGVRADVSITVNASCNIDDKFNSNLSF